MSDCKDLDQFSGVYTGNQVGTFNHTGLLNFLGGGPDGSGISSGTTVIHVLKSFINRAVWERGEAVLNQTLLDQAFPFIDLRWIADIRINADTLFRISNRNIYVEDEDGLPRFYEARSRNSPKIKISVGEWLASTFEIGDLNLTLNNRDGFFNDFLPQGTQFQTWVGASVVVKVGFGEKLSDYFEVFRGSVAPKKGVQTSNTEIRLKCFDQFEADNVSIPTLTLDSRNFPNADPDKTGKSLSIVYGDWETDVSDFGNVEALCSNAVESGATQFIWNVAEHSLESISEVFLHRSNRTEERDGAVKFINGAITIEPGNGRVIIPKGGTTLEESVTVLERAKPGAGSGLNKILAESSGQNFINAGILVGDQVFKQGTTTPAIVTTVASGQLLLSGGVTFGTDDNYFILTNQYTFKEGDRVSVKCKGKGLAIMSTTRVRDIVPDSNPLILSIGLHERGSFWIADNVAKDVKEITFNGEILRTIPYANIDGSIVNLTGMAAQVDNTLWIFENSQSKVYRFLLADQTVGLSFTTASVAGVGALAQGAALSIDDGNLLNLVDNATGTFYRIDVLGAAIPVLVSTFNRTAFEAGATDIVDTAHDVNLNQLVVMDRTLNKVFRVDEATGALISTIDLVATIAANFTNPAGVGYSVDGTLFFMNFVDFTIYNFNEDAGIDDNPGFIARDLLQTLAGKTTGDFDLLWNQVSRVDLSNFKGRLVINKKSTIIKEIHEFLIQFNTNFYIRFGRFSLFHINFTNFTTGGEPIREGDIKLESFQPKRESNQYFNSAVAENTKNHFTGKSVLSDNYISTSGVELAGQEIQRTLKLPGVYRRTDLDTLIPLFVRLAAADPEFVDMTVGFRFLFVQPSVFFNINFADFIKPEKTGKRFDNIPCFVRKITMDLNTMEFGLKVWSLGTTRFSGFEPAGVVAGGQGDPIVLTNLGTLGVIAPIGIITGGGGDTYSIEGSGPDVPEVRSSGIGGLAWKEGYKVAFVSGTTHEIIETREIIDVSGNAIQFDQAPGFGVANTVKNSAGFIVGGNYLKFASICDVAQDQSAFYTHFGKPSAGYPTLQTEEIEEQRAGLHNFDTGRLPYVLHPLGFIPPL